MATETEQIESIPTRALSSASITRRRFLRLGTVLAAGLLLPRSLHAVTRPEDREECHLKFYNIHTQEKLEVCYRREGQYRPEALQSVNALLRDHRTDEIHPIDPRLLDLLHAIRIEAGQDSCLNIISGYRSPATNAKLRRHSRGVARKSLHIVGHAADIRIPGIQTAKVRKIALRLSRGGVGFYPESDFVHVDIGQVRAW